MIASQFPRYDAMSVVAAAGGILPSSVSGDSSVSPSSSRDHGAYDRDTVMSLASMRGEPLAFISVGVLCTATSVMVPHFIAAREFCRGKFTLW